MGHVTSLLGFPPYSILHTSYHQASTQYAASLLCRKLFSYFPQRKETQSSISIFVIILENNFKCYCGIKKKLIICGDSLPDIWRRNSMYVILNLPPSPPAERDKNK